MVAKKSILFLGKNYRIPVRAAILIFAAAAGSSSLVARKWKFIRVPDPLEAEFVGIGNGAVVLQGTNGKCFELPIDRFSLDDQKFLRALAAANTPVTGVGGPGKPITNRSGYKVRTVETLTNQVVTPGPGSELHVTGKGDPIKGCYFNLAAADGWLFFPNIAPSKVAADFLGRMRENGAPAALDENLRVAQYESGSVVIPQGADFPAMTVFDGKSLGGSATSLKCQTAYDDAKLGAIRSFVLKRGYMATIAQQENGTGISRNYVAQDHDLVVGDLPAGLDNEVRFVRIFPWRWVSKKGSTHLLEFNEPDRPDQAPQEFVDEAFASARERFGPKRKDGARAMRGSGSGAKELLWSARDLRVGI